MAGLLYKDFIAIKGKIYVIVLSIVSILFVLLRVFVDDVAVEFLVGALIANIPVFLLIMVLFGLENGIMSADEGTNTQIYLLSLPVSGKEYVASKYWFLLISYYIILSVSQIWAITFAIREAEDGIYELVSNISGLMPILVCAFLVITAIELPFYILLGSRKGKQVKILIAMAMLFGVIAFLLFGNLALLDYLDFETLFAFLEKHTEILLGMVITAPIISLLLYYSSYRITCSIFERRERENER